MEKNTTLILTIFVALDFFSRPAALKLTGSPLKRPKNPYYRVADEPGYDTGNGYDTGMATKRLVHVRMGYLELIYFTFTKPTCKGKVILAFICNKQIHITFHGQCDRDRAI